MWLKLSLFSFDFQNNKSLLTIASENIVMITFLDYGDEQGAIEINKIFRKWFSVKIWAEGFAWKYTMIIPNISDSRNS